jgi:hypothetical protein
MKGMVDGEKLSKEFMGDNPINPKPAIAGNHKVPGEP